jgi:uncharacterized protein (TIGR00730 family)
MTFKRLCVYCGSRHGARPSYDRAARDLGAALGHRGIELIYGGGRVGLMGALAESVLSHGGKVIGVIPRSLVSREVAFLELADLRIVDSMHERKALMAELADAFIALPGGVGTLEELFEILTWAQLDLHRKPCGLLNVDQFYDLLLGFLDHAVAENFIPKKFHGSLLVDNDPERLLEMLQKSPMMPAKPILHPDET